MRRGAVVSQVGQRLDQAYSECRRQTRLHARTFFFASHVLPPEKRAGSYAVYTFCRRADNIVDLPASGAPQQELAQLRDLLDRVFGSAGTLEAPWLALRDTVQRFDIPIDYFHDLLRGVEMDLTKSRYVDFAELDEYCYCVASVVGLMMSRIFGVSDPAVLERALEMGTAMQLTNILRDVGEDYRMGRVYLPQKELAAYSYTEADLAEGRIDQRFKKLMEFQIARARDYYRKAAPGIEIIPDDGSRTCARLMSTTYAQILDRIEMNGYDVFRRRAFVPLSGKLRIAATALLQRTGGATTRPVRSMNHRPHHPPAARPAETRDSMSGEIR